MLILKNIFFTLLVPGMVAGWLPYLIIRASGPPWRFDIGAFRCIGLVPTVIGIGFYIWTVMDFAKTGRGTPAPIDPPRKLVSKGLYRVVRNPMYAGVLCVLLGEAIFFASPALLAYTLLIWLIVHLFVVYYEEPTLTRKFGEEYKSYRRSVPRWFPKLKARQ